MFLPDGTLISASAAPNCGSLILTASRRYSDVIYTSKIVDCVLCKMLFSVSNVMLGKTNTSPLSTNVPPHQLPHAFRNFFSTKIELIRNKLDSMQPTEISTAVPNIETPLVDFKPVPEEKVL